MNICTTYNQDSKKLCHVNMGQVIQFDNNDGTDDVGFYLVTESCGNATYVINMKTGKRISKSVSCRCIVYPDATLLPRGLENE